MNTAINNAGNAAALGQNPEIIVDLTRQEVADIILQSLLSTTQRTFREPTIPEDYALQLQTNNIHLQRVAQTLSGGNANAVMVQQQQQQQQQTYRIPILLLLHHQHLHLVWYNNNVHHNHHHQQILLHHHNNNN
eukprot:UN10503